MKKLVLNFSLSLFLLFVVTGPVFAGDAFGYPAVANVASADNVSVSAVGDDDNAAVSDFGYAGQALGMTKTASNSAYKVTDSKSLGDLGDKSYSQTDKRFADIVSPVKLFANLRMPDNGKQRLDGWGDNMIGVSPGNYQTSVRLTN